VTDVSISRVLARNAWTINHLIVAILLVGLGIALFADAWRSIWSLILERPSAAHIVLVPLSFAWLVWVRRQRFRFCQPVGQWVGFVFVAVGLATSTWGASRGIKVPYHGGAILFVIGCLLSAIGTDVLRQFFPAFVALLFLIPPPISIFEPMLEPLQVATADVTQVVYAAFGIPVELIGPYVRIEDTQVRASDVFYVLGVLFAFILIGYTVAFGAPLRISARIIILLTSVLAGVLVNVCRALATAWLYTIYSPERVGQIMVVAGWVILGVAFLVLLGVVRALLWASIPVRRYTLAHTA
jgi:exosortase